MTQDLSKLITWPEAQGANRVLQAISQLEQHLANLQAQKGMSSATIATSVSANAEASTEISRLRTENQKLNQRQSRALTKLEAFMDAIKAMPDPVQIDAEPETVAPMEKAA